MDSRYEKENCRRDGRPSAGGENQALGSALTGQDYTIQAREIKVRGRTVGETRLDRVFQKRISFQKHLYRKYNGIGFEVSSIEDAEKAGAIWAEIHNLDDHKIYHTALSLVRSAGRYVEHAGYGAQLVLPLKYWQSGPVSKDGPAQMPLLPGVPQ
jgi:hypothetical protein